MIRWSGHLVLAGALTFLVAGCANQPARGCSVSAPAANIDWTGNEMAHYLARVQAQCRVNADQVMATHRKFVATRPTTLEAADTVTLPFAKLTPTPPEPVYTTFVELDERMQQLVEVDTGAWLTGIPRRAAIELGLEIYPDTNPIMDVTGRTQVLEWARLPTISFVGPLRVRSLPVTVMPDVDGVADQTVVLGLDVLRQFRIGHWTASELTLLRQFPEQLASWRRLPLAYKTGLLQTRDCLRMNNICPHAFVDTGATGVLIYGVLADNLDHGRETSSERVGGRHGFVQAAGLRLPQIAIGPLTATDVPVILLPDAPAPLAVAVMGIDVLFALSGGRFAIDFETPALLVPQDEAGTQ